MKYFSTRGVRDSRNLANIPPRRNSTLCPLPANANSLFESENAPYVLHTECLTFLCLTRERQSACFVSLQVPTPWTMTGQFGGKAAVVSSHPPAQF